MGKIVVHSRARTENLDEIREMRRSRIRSGASRASTPGPGLGNGRDLLSEDDLMAVKQYNMISRIVARQQNDSYPLAYISIPKKSRRRQTKTSPTVYNDSYSSSEGGEDDTVPHVRDCSLEDLILAGQNEVEVFLRSRFASSQEPFDARRVRRTPFCVDESIFVPPRLCYVETESESEGSVVSDSDVSEGLPAAVIHALQREISELSLDMRPLNQEFSAITKEVRQKGLLQVIEDFFAGK